MSGALFLLTDLLVRFPFMKIINYNIYLEKFENCKYPQLEDLQPDVILKRDGAPPSY